MRVAVPYVKNEICEKFMLSFGREFMEFETLDCCRTAKQLLPRFVWSVANTAVGQPKLDNFHLLHDSALSHIARKTSLEILNSG